MTPIEQVFDHLNVVAIMADVVIFGVSAIGIFLAYRGVLLGKTLIGIFLDNSDAREQAVSGRNKDGQTLEEYIAERREIDQRNDLDRQNRGASR